MEIERIQQLAEKMENDDERTRVLSTIDVISDAFTQMLGTTKQFMLEGKRQKTDLTDASEAVQFLHDLGIRHGYDYPEGKNEQTVAEYVLRFGREIVFSERSTDKC